MQLLSIVKNVLIILLTYIQVLAYKFIYILQKDKFKLDYMYF